MSKEKNISVINVKLDAETKGKYETLAFLKGVKLQELTLELINDAISENADAIEQAIKLKNTIKK